MATFTKSFTYKHPIEAVLQVFVTESCFRTRMSEQGASNVRLMERKGLDFQYTFTVQRELPGFIPKLMRNKLAKFSKALLVEQRETWLQEGESKLSFHMMSYLDQFKVRVENKSVYTPTATGCINNMVMNVECDLPIIGSKLAEFICEENIQVMDDEYKLLKNLLHKHQTEQA